MGKQGPGKAGGWRAVPRQAESMQTPDSQEAAGSSPALGWQRELRIAKQPPAGIRSNTKTNPNRNSRRKPTKEKNNRLHGKLPGFCGGAGGAVTNFITGPLFSPPVCPHPSLLTRPHFQGDSPSDTSFLFPALQRPFHLCWWSGSSRGSPHSTGFLCRVRHQLEELPSILIWGVETSAPVSAPLQLLRRWPRSLSKLAPFAKTRHLTGANVKNL